jgi:Mg2+ and Co2+ transporter CorA
VISHLLQASLRLDISRNKVLVANIALSICSVNITFGAYITGIFGMNLDNTASIQPVQGVFATVWVGTFVLMIISTVSVYYYLVWTGVIHHDTQLVEKMLN